MDFGIVNPSAKVMYNDIPAGKLRIIEDALLRPTQENVDNLISLAQEIAEQAVDVIEKSDTDSFKKPVEERLKDALVKGNSSNLEADLQEALTKYEYAVKVIEGPLMDGMNNVGRLFGEGKMFLPQVVKAARCMKQAVTILQPYIDQQKVNKTSSAGKVLLATVKGDVHDIGKNIVSVVMACNGYEIIDLGVMVPAEEIVKKTLELKPDIIGLSGLITPSLDEMIKVVRLLKESDISVPVMIGGATTSPLHTALKIAPQYDGSVIWVKDASQNAPLAAKFINPVTREEAQDSLQREQKDLCEKDSPTDILSFDEARKRKLDLF
jgi:5-methyltetrahydrofolate--homocysteine methyltransferase